MSVELSIRPGDILGDWRIEGLLGRGSFKAVYAAENLAPQQNQWPRRVAICLPHVQDQEAHALLLNEVRVVGALSHPGIVREYGVEEVDGNLFAIMELVDGVSLSRLLRDQGPMPFAKALDLIRQTGAALDYAHAGLAIHRDIKPANVIVNTQGQVKILDFGLARLLAHSQYRATTRVGSVAYMAPEQFSGSTGMNADLWSLGVTFYQLLTNTLPFPARDEGSLLHQILYAEPDLEPLDTSEFDPRLARVIAKMLAKDPEQRYQSAADFINDLQAVQQHAALVNHVEGQIEVYLRAHFPLICLQTDEEDRAMDSLRKVREAMAVKKPIKLFIWSETQGLRDADGQRVPETAGDPLLALEHVFRGQDEAIYVFLDMHRHFTPICIRLIRDAVWTVKRARKSLVFLGPSHALPDELLADATLLFYPPPDAEIMEKQVEAAAQEHGLLKLDGALKENLARALLGLTEREAGRVLRRGILRHGGLNEDCAREVLLEKEQAVRKEGILEFCHAPSGFAEVGGLEPLKAWFAQRRRAFDPAGRRFGLRPPKGVVLVGWPGCGKSLTAKALAADWQTPLLRLDLGKVYASLVGESESRLRRALHMAEAVSPCILWIDELEKAFSGMGQARDNGVSTRLFGAFLTWLEDREGPVFVVATANDIRRLPPEFTRKGRFDEIFYVGLPNAIEREAVFRVHLNRRQRDPGHFDITQLVAASAGFSGAEIEAVVVSGLYRAFTEEVRDLHNDDLLAALGETQPLSKTRPDDLTFLQNWASRNARPAQLV